MPFRAKALRLFGTWLVLMGCGSGPRYQGEWFQKPEPSRPSGQVRYQIREPGSNWTTLSDQVGADIAWRHRHSDAVMQVHSACEKDLDVPLQTLTRHLTIGFTETEIQSQETVAMDGREALKTVVQGKLDGVPREIVLQVLKKDGCVYDFVIASAPGQNMALQNARSDFERLVQGFHAP